MGDSRRNVYAEGYFVGYEAHLETGNLSLLIWIWEEIVLDKWQPYGGRGNCYRHPGRIQNPGGIFRYETGGDRIQEFWSGCSLPALVHYLPW